MNTDEILKAAAERAEMRQMVSNDNHMEPWQVHAQMFNRIFNAFERKDDEK